MYTYPDQANWQLCRDNGLPPPITRHALHPFINALRKSHGVYMNWILRCCVCCSTSVTEFLWYIWGAWNFWLTFGACDHVIFELGCSYIIPKFCYGGEGGVKTSKGILENLGNGRKKLTNLKILKQLYYSLVKLGTFHRQNRWQNVFAYPPRVDSVRSHESSV